MSIPFLHAQRGIVKLLLRIGIVVGNYFYTVGGYAAFTVPEGFPFGGMSQGVTRVTASSMPFYSFVIYCASTNFYRWPLTKNRPN